MAIIYGTYNQALESYVGVQSVGSTDTFYFTLPWHRASYVESLNIWNTTGTNMTIDAIYLVNNGPHYRYNPSDAGHIMYSDQTDKVGKAAQGYYVTYSMGDGAFVQNLYNRNYLDVIVVTTTSLSSPKLYCQAIGRKAIPTPASLSGQTNIEVDKSYRVLMGKNQTGAGGTGGTCYDITGVMTGKGGDNLLQAGFATTYDYLYVGSTKKLEHWDFILSGVGQTNATLNAQYWNGTTWSATGVTVVDGTSHVLDTMRFSGLLENKGFNAMSSLWKKTRMSGTGLSLLTDPNYTYVEAVNAGTVQPGTLAWDPERYWMRFSVSKVVGSGVSFQQVLPVMESYDDFISY